MQACPGAAGRIAIPDLTTRTSAMSSQAAVHSIDELKNFRVALALYGEDTLGTLGAVEAEVRRTLRWLEEERPVYWQDQIKRRREQVAMARAEVFKRNLQKKARLHPADVRAEGNPAQGRGQPARRREAAGDGPEVAAALPARRPRVPRERPAAEGPGRRRRPQRRQPADPDDRRPGGLSAGRAAVRPGSGQPKRRPAVRLRRPSSSRSRPTVLDETRPPSRPKPRRELEAEAEARAQPRRPPRSTDAWRVTKPRPTQHRTHLFDWGRSWIGGTLLFAEDRGDNACPTRKSWPVQPA